MYNFGCGVENVSSRCWNYAIVDIWHKNWILRNSIKASGQTKPICPVNMNDRWSWPVTTLSGRLSKLFRSNFRKFEVVGTNSTRLVDKNMYKSFRSFACGILFPKFSVPSGRFTFLSLVVNGLRDNVYLRTLPSISFGIVKVSKNIGTESFVNASKSHVRMGRS